MSKDEKRFVLWAIISFLAIALLSSCTKPDHANVYETKAWKNGVRIAYIYNGDTVMSHESFYCNKLSAAEKADAIRFYFREAMMDSMSMDMVRVVSVEAGTCQ
jgi:uncharacterized lipoprotein YehR (DUF1307 family)